MEYEKQLAIVKQFVPIFDRHKDECLGMIREWLAYSIGRVKAERDALPKKGENTLKNRQREKMLSDEWKTKNPIPDSIITAESAVILCMLNDALLDSGELSQMFIEQAGIQRMITDEERMGFNGVLLEAVRPTRALDAQGALERLQRHWPEQKKEDGQLSAITKLLDGIHKNTKQHSQTQSGNDPPETTGRPPRWIWDGVHGKILQRWHDARAIKGISVPQFLKENPDVFRGKAMDWREHEMRCLLNSAGKRK